MTLPKAFDERIRIQLGDEYEDYIKCFDSDMYHGIRVNTSKISVEDFLKISPFELEPVPWTKNGFYYDHRKYTPSKHQRNHRDGIQHAVSYKICLVLIINSRFYLIQNL